MQIDRNSPGNLADVIERILDKGLVINADIAVSVVGVQLLGIKIRAALASFETAARYGLEFPLGTRLDTTAWHELTAGKETCPRCSRRSPAEDLLGTGCPWCGWLSASTKRSLETPSGNGHRREELPSVEIR
ncbi:MAG: gas vesicle protein [Chloroflexi bacterium]|nr:gas vesicle protein [Chloroflexota bacterium]